MEARPFRYPPPNRRLLRCSLKETDEMRNRFAFFFLLAAVLVTSFPRGSSAAPEKTASAAALEVTYYYLPT